VNQGSKSNENSPKNKDGVTGTMTEIKNKSIASPKLVSRFSPINTLVKNNLTVNTGMRGALNKYT
jgi:hypothetical protein